MTLKSSFILLGFMLCSLLWTACGQDALDTSRERITGEWTQIEPSCTSDCATINFQASEFVNSNLNYIDGESYEIVDEEVLRIGNRTYFYNFMNSYQNLEIQNLLEDSSGNTMTINLLRN